jgi:dUTP pyrophosphatase
MLVYDISQATQHHVYTPVGGDMEEGDRVLRVDIRKLRDGDVPSKQTQGSSGYDLSAAIGGPLEIFPGEWELIPTGWGVAIPYGYEGQIRPRSGLALRHGITVLNAPGTIDSDYRGEVKVLLINFGKGVFVVRPGDRIAQLVIVPIVAVDFRVVEELDSTLRSAGGYGSTGI